MEIRDLRCPGHLRIQICIFRIRIFVLSEPFRISLFLSLSFKTGIKIRIEIKSRMSFKLRLLKIPFQVSNTELEIQLLRNEFRSLK